MSANQKDNKEPDSNSGFIYSSTLSVSVMLVIGLIILYMNQASIGTYFNGILWGGIPLIIFLLGASINMVGQRITCGNINPGSAFYGALPVVALLLAGIGLGQISYFRAPVASLFAQIPNVTVIEVENKYPYIKGAGVAYWAFWGVMLGQVIGSSTSTIC